MLNAAVLVILLSGVLAVQLDKEEQDTFRRIDLNHDNHLVKSEFDKMVTMIDPNHDNSITFTEFVHLTGLSARVAMVKFHIYDKNHDNIIDWKDTELVIRAMDLDHNGFVDIAEFAKTYYPVLTGQSGPLIGK